MKIPSDAPTAAVVHAIEANEDERFAYISRLPGAEYHPGSELTWFLTGIPYLLFNGVLSARLPPDDLDRRITRALAPFATRKLPMFWMTGPSTQPTDLDQRLLAAGLCDAGTLVGMAADLATIHDNGAAPPALSIERVRDLATLQRWVDTFSAGFGYPPDVAHSFLTAFAALGVEARSPHAHYLGLVAGVPVATASAFLAAGVVGMYSVSTLPAWRRQGIGAAMTLAVLRDARARGYHIGILHAESAGLGLYRRLGFREYCTLHPYLWAPGSSGSPGSPSE